MVPSSKWIRTSRLSPEYLNRFICLNVDCGSNPHGTTKISNTSRFKKNLIVWFIYILVVYILLIPLKIWIIGISISILIGLLFGLLNDIILQLRKLNGEKF
jgi:hypothetical protein